ncbi:MAG: hypothetical protein ACJAS4_003178 [Bacteriovoracaceae bacterium]|jgi:hypothetical protein
MTKNLINSLFICSVIIAPSFVFAESNTGVSTESNLTSFLTTTTSNLKTKLLSPNKDSLLQGDFGFTANGLVKDVGDVVGNKHHGSLNIKYQSYSDTGVYKGLEIATKVNDEEVLQYSIKEALIEFKYSTSRLAMGRTNLNWSHADEIWSLGKVNNRMNFDYFEPDQEGLIGLFYDKKFSNGISLSAFGSFLYVPEMSQGLVIDKDAGSVVCKTPWCEAPSPSAEIEGRNVPIYYDVEYPEVSDVVLRQSLGLNLGYEINKYVRLSGFYLRKPENEISVTAEVSAEADLSKITAVVTPQFYYHDVKGGNIEITVSDELKLYGSAISTAPNKFPDSKEPFIEYTGIKPKKKAEDYLSGGLLYNNGDIKGHAGYIARVSDFDTENDILVNYPRWNQAVHLAVSKNLSRKIFVALDYKYDMLTEDRLTMFKTSYSYGPSIVATIGVNMIGSSDSKDSFWSKYENNDSVFSSLKYTF